MALTGRICTECKIKKPINDFSWAVKGKQYHSHCKECRRKEYFIRKAKNPKLFLEKARKSINKWREKNPLYGREHYAQREYKISAAELTSHAERLKIEQNGKCDICGIVGEVIGLLARRDVVRLVIDHNHKTGKLRSLLCDACNKALGWVNEDKIIIKSLLSYIEKWEQEDKKL